MLTGFLVNGQVQYVQVEKIKENLQESAELWAGMVTLHVNDPSRLQLPLPSKKWSSTPVYPYQPGWNCRC